MFRCFIFLAFASFVGSVSAGFMTGNKLKSYMDDSEKGAFFNGGVYRGYIIGVHDAFDSVLFCTPKDATQGQVTAVVSKYLNANPETWNKPADEIIVSALLIAFPCKKN